MQTEQPMKNPYPQHEDVAKKQAWHKPRLIELAMRQTQAQATPGPEGAATIGDPFPTGRS